MFHRKVALLDTGMPENWRDTLDKYYKRINVEQVSFLSEKRSTWNDHGSLTLFEFTRPLWDVTVYLLETIDGSGSGSFEDFDAALAWCCGMDLDWVHTSTGFTEINWWQRTKLAMRSRRLRNRGVTLSASAGNQWSGPVMYPAALPEWMAIGADAAWASVGDEVLFSMKGAPRAAVGIFGPKEWTGTSRTAPDVAGAAYRMALEFGKIPEPIERREVQKMLMFLLCFMAKPSPELNRRHEILRRNPRTGFGTLDDLYDTMLKQYDLIPEDNVPCSLSSPN